MLLLESYFILNDTLYNLFEYFEVTKIWIYSTVVGYIIILLLLHVTSRVENDYTISDNNVMFYSLIYFLPGLLTYIIDFIIFGITKCIIIKKLLKNQSTFTNNHELGMV